MENEKTEGNPNAIARAAWKALHFQANGNEKQGTIVETYCLMRDIAALAAPFEAGIQSRYRAKADRRSVHGGNRYPCLARQITGQYKQPPVVSILSLFVVLV